MPGAPSRMMRLSGMVGIVREDGCCADDVDDEAAAEAEMACPFVVGGFDEPFVSVLALEEGAEESPKPHVHCSCARRAGFGNVLYVEPSEVYLPHQHQRPPHTRRPRPRKGISLTLGHKASNRVCGSA